MTAGDPIWYRQYGGPAYSWEVPGEFVKATARRVIVRLRLKSGTEVTVAVLAKNVRPRDPDAALWEAPA